MSSLFGLAIGLALASVLAFSEPAPAEDNAQLKAEVQALLDQAAKGFETKDIKAVLAISTQETIIRHLDGRKVAIADWSRDVANQLTDWQDAKSSFKVEQAWPTGPDRAGALYTERHEFSRAAEPGHRLAITAKFQALLTRTPKGWRVLEFIEKDLKFLKDGQEIKP